MVNKMYKELFPVYKNNKDLVYLDNAASSLKPYEVLDAISDYYTNYSTNIERGMYELSMVATKKVEDARCEVAHFINADRNEVIFTRGCSNSLNMVALSLRHLINEGDEIITSEAEHHSSFLPWLKIAKEKKAVLKFVELDEDYKITIDNFKKVLSNKTKVVALNHVSNVTGYTTPVKEITRLAHEYNAFVSIDGAQAIPHNKIDVKDIDCDFYSFSFHKMCGPTGLGILYGKKEVLNKIEPAEFGGEMNSEVSLNSVSYKDIPYKFETGTLPIASIFASKACIDFINKIGYSYIHNRTLELSKKAFDQLSKMDEIEIYNKKDITPIITFNIKGVHPHDAAHMLTDLGICLRSGQHCAEPLHNRIGSYSTLRISFYFYNDEEDVNRLVDSVKRTIDFFKEVSYIG